MLQLGNIYLANQLKACSKSPRALIDKDLFKAKVYHDFLCRKASCLVGGGGTALSPKKISAEGFEVSLLIQRMPFPLLRRRKSLLKIESTTLPRCQRLSLLLPLPFSAPRPCVQLPRALVMLRVWLVKPFPTWLSHFWFEIPQQMPILASSPIFKFPVLENLVGDGELSVDVTSTLNLDPIKGAEAHLGEAEDPACYMNADGHDKEANANLGREVITTLR